MPYSRHREFSETLPELELELEFHIFYSKELYLEFFSPSLSLFLFILKYIVSWAITIVTNVHAKGQVLINIMTSLALSLGCITQIDFLNDTACGVRSITTMVTSILS